MATKVNQEDRPSADPHESEGQTPSSENVEKSPGGASLRRSQTIGQKLMGNMMDNSPLSLRTQF